MFKFLGFIGLGAMGEPMCRNLSLSRHEKILAFDLNSAPLERLVNTIPKILAVSFASSLNVS